MCVSVSVYMCTRTEEGGEGRMKKSRQVEGDSSRLINSLTTCVSPRLARRPRSSPQLRVRCPLGQRPANSPSGLSPYFPYAV